MALWTALVFRQMGRRLSGNASWKIVEPEANRKLVRGGWFLRTVLAGRRNSSAAQPPIPTRLERGFFTNSAISFLTLPKSPSDRSPGLQVNCLLQSFLAPEKRSWRL